MLYVRLYGSYLWIVLCSEEKHTVKTSLHLLHHILLVITVYMVKVFDLVVSKTFTSYQIS